MLKWLWRILWGTSTTPPRPSLGRLQAEHTELEERVSALERTQKRMWGRVTGGVRSQLDQDEDPPQDPSQLDIEDELDEELLQSRALGARRRFGKEV